jgi:hypothetical protein
MTKSAKQSTALFWEVRSKNIPLRLQICATRAGKEVWRIQGFVFSTELAVRNSVSDCQFFIYEIFLLCLGTAINPLSQYYSVSKRYFRHCGFWYQCRTVILSTSVTIFYHYYLASISNRWQCRIVNLHNLFDLTENPLSQDGNSKACPISKTFWCTRNRGNTEGRGIWRRVRRTSEFFKPRENIIIIIT